MGTLLATLGCAVALAQPSVEDASRLLDAWQMEAAKEQAETLLAAEPRDPVRQTLAAEVLHQTGDHVAALALLRAAGDTPRGEGVRPLVEASAGYAALFETLETPHFRVRYVGKDEIVAHYAVPVLESAYTNIGADLEFAAAEAGEKIVVEIYPDARGLAGATGLTLKEIETSGTIAVCKFHRLMITSPLATLGGYGWADTIAHEFTHLVISKKSHNRIPIWLHEGIAKYFESRWSGQAGQALGPYSEKLLAQAVRKHDFVTFAQMHPSMAKLPSQEKAALAFAEVFTMVEFLTRKAGTHGIARVLEEAGRGAATEAALERVFGQDLRGLEPAWKAYLQKRPFKEEPGATAQRIHLAARGDDNATQERPLEDIADKAAHDAARLGELLQLRSHPKAAVVEYERALQQGGLRYSTLVNRLARAYVEVGRRDDAKRLIERGLKAHPDDIDAHLLAGRIALSEQAWPQAQAHFEAARLQNPFNPEIHAALASLYSQAGKKPLAAEEKHFFELSSQPRPPRDYEAPAAPVGEAYLSVASLPWGTVELDGKPIRTPAWDMPVAAGKHALQFARPGGGTATNSVDVGPDAHAVAVLR